MDLYPFCDPSLAYCTINFQRLVLSASNWGVFQVCTCEWKILVSTYYVIFLKARPTWINQPDQLLTYLAIKQVLNILLDYDCQLFHCLGHSKGYPLDAESSPKLFE